MEQELAHALIARQKCQKICRQDWSPSQVRRIKEHIKTDKKEKLLTEKILTKKAMQECGKVSRDIWIFLER